MCHFGRRSENFMDSSTIILIVNFFSKYFNLLFNQISNKIKIFSGKNLHEKVFFVFPFIVTLTHNTYYIYKNEIIYTDFNTVMCVAVTYAKGST